jgi:hypothetical protein
MGFSMSSSVDESTESSGMCWYVSDEWDDGEIWSLREGGPREGREGTEDWEYNRSEGWTMEFSNWVEVVDETEEDRVWRIGALWKSFSWLANVTKLVLGDINMGCLTVRTNFTVVTLGPVPRTGWSRMLSYDVLGVYYPQSNVELSWWSLSWEIVSPWASWEAIPKGSAPLEEWRDVWTSQGKEVIWWFYFDKTRTPKGSDVWGHVSGAPGTNKSPYTKVDQGTGLSG